MSYEEFRRIVWKHWKENGRHTLPWRHLPAGRQGQNAYKILVSEVMLQQTQVPRVLEKYKEFLKKFPNVRALSKASLSDVLKVWSGLGYNRRGKYLHDAAKIVVTMRGGKFPQSYLELRTLPGVGDYTAKAVRVFAFNEVEVLLETNIRAVFIHHFHSSFLPARRSLGAGGQKARIDDAEIIPRTIKAAKGQDPREWHAALMDYGTFLKREFPNPSRRSKHHVTQSKFEGSLRQVRGEILRILSAGPKTEKSIYALIRANKNLDHSHAEKALEGLARDGLIKKTKKGWCIM